LVRRACRSGGVGAIHTTNPRQPVERHGLRLHDRADPGQRQHGVRTLGTVTEPDGLPPALTTLTLTGYTLTWQHNGSPRSAQPQP
jgi:hypothetical protein